MNGLNKLKFKCTNEKCEEYVPFEKYAKHLINCELITSHNNSSLRR